MTYQCRFTEKKFTLSRDWIYRFYIFVSNLKVCYFFFYWIICLRISLLCIFDEQFYRGFLKNHQTRILAELFKLTLIPRAQSSKSYRGTLGYCVIRQSFNIGNRRKIQAACKCKTDFGNCVFANRVVFFELPGKPYDICERDSGKVAG